MNLSEENQRDHYNTNFNKENYKHSNYGSYLMRKEISQNFFLKFPNRLKLGKVLEIGCNNGMLSQYLDGYYDFFCGIDIADKAIDFANQKFAVTNKVEFINLNICNKDNNLGKFDTIIFNSSLHHMPFTIELFNNIQSYSKESTLIIFLEPHSNNKLFQIARYIRAKIDKSFTEDQNFFNPEKLNSKLKDYGFDVIKNEYYGFLTPAFSEVSFPPEFIFRQFAKLFIMLDKFLYKFLPKGILKYSWKYGTYCKIK